MTPTDPEPMSSRKAERLSTEERMTEMVRLNKEAEEQDPGEDGGPGGL